MRVEELGEFGLIERIRKMLPLKDSRVIVGAGDDCCGVQPGPDRVIIASTDSFVEGVHFDLGYFSYRQVGLRAMSASLSDIAAMGGVPICALVSLFLPKEFEVEAVDEIYSGMREVGDRYWVSLAGGDTVRSPNLSLSLTVIGEVEKVNLTLRSGAKVGDSICVTGALGRSGAGLLAFQRMLRLNERVHESHLSPLPRINEARTLVDSARPHSMIDISDGLAADLHHITEESGVGARVYQDRIPVAEEAEMVAPILRSSPLDLALYWGEDFELLFTIPKERFHQAKESLEGTVQVTEIGEIVPKEEGVGLVTSSGFQLLPRTGYDHFR